MRRSLLRDQVRLALIERVISGAIASGERLNEAALAAELQISRTPLKEAILAMEREGFAQAGPRGGHVVTPLSRDEIEEIYPMLMAYEGLVIMRHPPDAEALAEMADLNAQLANTDDPLQRVKLDELFHAKLAACCPNRLLLRSIRVLKLVIRRYGVRYPTLAVDRSRSVAGHETILVALREGELVAALSALEQHWDAALERMLSALAADPPAP